MDRLLYQTESTLFNKTSSSLIKVQFIQFHKDVVVATEVSITPNQEVHMILYVCELKA